MAKNSFDIMGDMGGGGIGPSFMRKKTQRQEKQSGAQAAGEGAERLGRFGGAMKKDTGEDAVTKLQKYAQSELEREKKKKAEAEAAKKKQKEGGVAPTKGFIERMRDYWFPSSEKK
jgi:hypothetical protein